MRRAVSAPIESRNVEARYFDFLDLHYALPARTFIDSVHLDAQGHRLLADQIAPTLEAMLRHVGRARRDNEPPERNYESHRKFGGTHF